MDLTPDSLLPVLPRSDALARIEQFLEEVAEGLEAPPPQPRRGRPTILPALCLWLGLVVCVLRGKRYQRDLWRLLAHGGLWSYPRFAVSDDAVYARLDEAGVGPMRQLLAEVTQVLADRLAPYVQHDLAPFATEVVALDESTLEQLARRLPCLRALPKGDPALVGGTLAGVFDLRRQQWRTVAYRTDWQQNEKVAAREVIALLPAGSLILADLGYFGFEWFDDLTDAKHSWISRLRQKTSWESIHVFYQDATTLDAIVWLGAYRADRAKHAVRLVQFTVGPVQYQYLTNVLDPHRLSIRQIAGLYQRRWDFELAVNTVKTQLGLHLLWSSKPVVIEQQVLATLILAQILQALRLEIAGRAGVDPFEVSLDLMIRYLPDFAAQGLDPIEAFLTNARALGFIRPSTRTKNRAPEIDLALIRPPPPGLILVRIPRYAQRNCGPSHDRTHPRRN
jgi:Transposase DDE domain